MLEVLMTAVSYSAAIALAAAGITLIYMTTGTFNFSHASMTAFGLYTVFIFSKVLFRDLGYPTYVFFPVAALISGVLGVITYLSVNRWLLKRRADMVTLMMSTLGVDLIYLALLNIIADYLTQKYKVNARLIVLSTEDVSIVQSGDFVLRGIPIVSVSIVMTVIILLKYILNRTKFGIAVRVTIENPSLAEIVGINPEVVYLTSWFLGGAFAGLAGAILSMVITGTPAVGSLVIVPEFAGAIVGGIYSLFGSLAGGYLIGLSEYILITLLATYVSRNLVVYQPLIPLLVMSVFLLFYPEGIGGLQLSRVVERLRKSVWR
ncbi:MAG: branched-chain amino acid ABC transporter permease [Candidatus Korarchaeum sp.]